MPASKEYTKWKIYEYRRLSKERAVAYKGGKCERCGYCKNLAALEFHHLDPTKKDFQLSKGNYLSWENCLPELDKCQLLCANCHREVHDELRKPSKVALEVEAQKGKPPKRALRVTLTCPVCTKEFKVFPSRVREGVRQTCSRSCNGKWGARVVWPSPEALAQMLEQEPMTKVAARIGVSDVGLKKHCTLRNIPVPPRGHWARKVD